MRKVLIATFSVAVVSLIATYPTRKEPPKPTEAEIVAQLPKAVQVLLPGGLCDNIHGAFLLEVDTFRTTPQPKQAEVLARIAYYRGLLREKGCG